MTNIAVAVSAGFGSGTDQLDGGVEQRLVDAAHDQRFPGEVDLGQQRRAGQGASGGLGKRARITSAKRFSIRRNWRSRVCRGPWQAMGMGVGDTRYGVVSRLRRRQLNRIWMSQTSR